MADDTNFMDFHTCVKTIQKQKCYGLKKLPNRLNANKISLNVSKTKKQLDHEVKTKLNGKKLYQNDPVKNLETHLNTNLT